MDHEREQIPKWLSDLQENSWELELLISGGAIFTLFQMSDYWIEWMNSIRITSGMPGHNIIMMLGTVGIEILKVGFITHLLLRAFWLSMVCVNYVFPTGIKQNKIKWKKPFNENFDEEKDLQKPILKVDQYSGLIMYLSLISTFILAGIIFTIFLLFSIPFAFGVNIEAVSNILFIGFLFYLFDLITFGLLRKIPILTYIFFPFFIFFDLVTFRKIFQKSALLFSTNISKWKFTFFAILFFSFAITFSYINVYRVMHWPNILDKRDYKWQMAEGEYLSYKAYRDQHSIHDNSMFSIQSKLITDNYLDLFFKYHHKEDYLMTLVDSSDSINYISDLIDVYLNDEKVISPEWHPTWTKEIYNIGITSMISIEHLSDGKHVLSFRIKPSVIEVLKEKYQNDVISLTEVLRQYSNTGIIPFWKDSEINYPKQKSPKPLWDGTL